MRHCLCLVGFVLVKHRNYEVTEDSYLVSTAFMNTTPNADHDDAHDDEEDDISVEGSLCKDIERIRSFATHCARRLR